MFYRKYRSNGFKAEDKVIVDRIRDECFQAVQTSKENYLKSLGVKPIDKATSWSIVNSLLNKCKIPRILPILVAGKIITDCKEKEDDAMFELEFVLADLEKEKYGSLKLADFLIFVACSDRIPSFTNKFCTLKLV